VSSPFGDAMRIATVPLASSQTVAPKKSVGWLARLRHAFGSDAADVRAPADLYDAVVHLVGDAADDIEAEPRLASLGSPVVRIAIDADLPSCWVQDQRFLDALARAMPADRRNGLERIARAWAARNDDKLHRAMLAVADHLLLAARQVEEVDAGS